MLTESPVEAGVNHGSRFLFYAKLLVSSFSGGHEHAIGRVDDLQIGDIDAFITRKRYANTTKVCLGFYFLNHRQAP